MRHYIYVYYQVGNIGGKEVDTIDDQPEDGFPDFDSAKDHLLELIESRKGHYFDRPWYKFTILPTWNSKSALDKQ